MTNKATWEEAVKLICSIRKGGMDDKQFEATVEHNISSLLLSQRKELMELCCNDCYNALQLTDEKET